MTPRIFKNKKAAQSKVERISNKLDHVLIAESRQSLRRKWRTYSHRQKILLACVGLALLSGVVGTVFVLTRKSPPPPPAKAPSEPQYDESTGSIIFQYKPKQ